MKLLPFEKTSGGRGFKSLPARFKINPKMTDSNILKHEFIPKHSKLSEKEVEELLNKYNISKKQLPKILKGDAAIKHLELSSGDIVKIIRKSITAGESIYYRVVINA